MIAQSDNPSAALQVYQRRLAEAGGVETLLTAMHRFVEFPMVQLSVILCLIPLSLGALCNRNNIPIVEPC